MSDTPLQDVIIDDKKYRPVQEGLASILAPYQEQKSGTAKKGHNNDEGNQAVFYNPIQQFNRDLTVLAILTFGEGAIVEKIARQAAKGPRGRGPKKPKKPTGCPEVVDDVAQSTSNKRKADELEEVVDAGAAKRARGEECEADEDEMEVMQLNGDSHDIPTTLEDPAKPAEDTSAANSKVPSKKVRFCILDALSATGLRALRYAREIPFVTHVVANDISKEAIKSIELNIDHNEVKDIVHSNVDDARAYMYSKVGNERSSSESYVHRFDVVDLDPYGTAAPFLDSAVQCLTDGGLLCVTCTDAGVFASNGYPEKAFSLYGGIPCKGPWSHEAGLRLILNAIAMNGAKYGIAVEPLLSLSIDFYARVFVRVHKSPQDVKMLAGTTMMVYNCDAGCGAWATQALARNQAKEDKKGGAFYKHSFAQAPSVNPLCEHCNSKMHFGGPFWAGPLHNPYFVQRMLDKVPTLDPKIYGTTDRLRGMLTLALEEDLTLASSNTQANTSASKSSSTPAPEVIPRLPAMTLDSSPFFFIPGFLAKVLHCATPSEDQLRGAIRSMGYLVTRSHCKPGSFKTNAPWSTLWEIMRQWIRQKSPIKEGAVIPSNPGWKILQRSQDQPAQMTYDVADELKSGLQNVKGEEDLKTLLRNAMYRLEHEKPAAMDKAPVPPDESQPNGAAKSAGEVRFDEALGKEKPRGKLVRYQINPRSNWGPMNRASGRN